MLACATKRTLLVSGHDGEIPGAAANHMIHYYEPLSLSLAKTGRFKTIERIGHHTTVSVFRCTV
jgi:hypothetical protein